MSGTADLSEAIAKIQVAMRSLGLGWDSPRLAKWLDAAAERYTEKCATVGRLPFPPAPWRRLADLPEEVVRGLANVLWAQLERQEETNEGKPRADCDAAD